MLREGVKGRSECMRVQVLLLRNCEFAARVLPPATAAALDRCRSERSKILVSGKRFHLKLPLWLLIEGGAPNLDGQLSCQICESVPSSTASAVC